MTLHRASLLGVQLSTASFAQTVALISDTIRTRGRLAVSPSPVYTVMRGHDDAEVRAALNANLATPDGMPVVWALRLLGHRHVERVYGPDLMRAVCAASVEPGWAHYFYGSAEAVPHRLAAGLQAQYPGLKIAGAESPPFRPLTADEETAMLVRLNESGADVIWIGLGSPKQDLWAARYRRFLVAPVIIAVGAAFDLLSGGMPQAPKWAQRSGLEWLYRLSHEPRRLWKRYLIYNPRFVLLVARQLVWPGPGR